MLKRKDWQLFQGQDGSGTESDSGSGTSEDVTPAEQSSSQDEQADSPAADSTVTSDDDEDLDVRRLEDLSEDDFESNKDATDLEAAALKERWLAASKEDAAKLPKAALACRLCKGVLMLGPASLRQHLESKRHTVRQKRKAEDYEPVILAIGTQAAPELETHQERLQRTKALLSTQSEDKKKAKKRKRGRKNPDSEDTKPYKGSKPGKRQRAELKAAKFAKKGNHTTKREKDQSASLTLPQGPATVKSAFWGTPEAKKADTAKKSFKPKGKLKRKPEKGTDKQPSASSIANRAERRRVKKERMKSLMPNN